MDGNLKMRVPYERVGCFHPGSKQLEINPLEVMIYLVACISPGQIIDERKRTYIRTL
jgi:hypothetical protein